jgi:hypothetical protein
MINHKVRHLYYWWDRQSIVDPADIRDQYFTVSYDQKGRIVRIVKYNRNNIMLGYEYLSWKGSWLVKVEDYSLDNVLQYKITYHYNKLGFLVEEKFVSANGEVTSILDNQEQDFIDILGEWLFRLLQFPIIETRGLVNSVREQFNLLK